MQHKGFSAAAKAMGSSKSLLSRRVAELENRLGIRLLNRSSRHFSVTALGERYAEQCARMLEQADLAEHLVADSLAYPRGRLVVCAPVAMSEIVLAPLVAEFLKSYPDVHIELLAINRDVDVIEEGIDIAIRAKPLPLADSDLHMHTLDRRHDILVASPQLIERHPELTVSIDSLKKVPTLSRLSNAGSHSWILEHATEGRKRIDLQPRLISSNFAALICAAIEGIGVALLPQLVCKESLASGKLQRIFSGWYSQEVLVHALFASSRGTSPAFRAFMDCLSKHFEQSSAVLDLAFPTEKPRGSASNSSQQFPTYHTQSSTPNPLK
ncbi:MAG: LysR family transcriptional regulator [Azonexus sp.]|uniref:LysR substrate-binding domain-containing protein n=1 Tax=Azonexus sp. TaxID=1872668 RepID=UPI00283069BC|nr:LysR substrate-binding domain-containing protein [Azonexus sp.]MDR0775571.1 LysR family transcriptional regulator [Azonexus sp.]